MIRKSCIFLVFAFSSFCFSHAGAGELNIPELFTTLNSTVYIPCNVDTGTDHEHMTPISWTREGYDGFEQVLMAPDVVPPSNIDLHSSRINSFDSLVVRHMVNSMSGTYTCHTDKGNASTLVHVLDGGDCRDNTLVHGLDGESPPIVSSIESQNSPSPCSESFDFVHGKCLYYSNTKKKWKDAHFDCAARTSSLITFKDVKDLLSFLLNLQNSGPTHYQFQMWTGHAHFDESNSRFGALQNDAQVSPMLYKGNARLSSCGRLNSATLAYIVPITSAECESDMNYYLCEKPTL